MSPRVLLLFTPPADPAQPYASLPTLAAFLRAHDVDVRMADLNIEAVHYLLAPERLQSSLGAVREWVKQAEAREALDAVSADRYLRAVHASAFGESTIAKVSAAVAALRSSKTYRDMATFCTTIDVVDAAYRLVSAASYPAVATRHKLESAVDIWNAECLWELASHADATPFSRWVCERVETLIDAYQPHVVGVSLTFPDQLPLAFAALRKVRDIDRDIVTCLGGATASRLAMRTSQLGTLLSVVDCLVVGEGEAALLEVARRAQARMPLLGVPNTICSTETGPVSGPLGPTLAMDSLPLPAYADVDLDAYLAPVPVLLLSGSRACYWGKCKFCDVSGTASERYRHRSLDRLVEDFSDLHRFTGARHFMFGDLAIPPERLARLGDRLRERQLDAHWLCQARLETGFTPSRIQRMADGGCRLLVFGLESANQRVLDRMAKGTRFAGTEAILTACSDSGIAVNLQTFVGFPGETEEEARKTASFVIAQRHAVTSVALTSFKLIEGTSAFEDASALGLSGLRQLEGTMDVLWDYDVAAGLTSEQADALVRELYQDLARAFPAVANGLSWNAYALLLVSAGGPDALRSAQPNGTASAGVVHLRSDIMVRRLPFHVGELADLLHGSSANAPRHDVRNVSHSRVSSSVGRHPTWTLLDPRNQRAVPVSDGLAPAILADVNAVTALDRRSSAKERVRLAGELIRLLDAGFLVGAVGSSDSVAASEVVS